MKSASRAKRAQVRSSNASRSYLVCAFQFGRCNRSRIDANSVDEAVQRTEKYRPDEPTDVIRTEIIDMGNYPSGVHKGYRHTYSDLEKDQPHTLFVGAISWEDLEYQKRAANTIAWEREKDLQQRIQAALHLTAETVSIDDLPERWTRYIRRTPKGCWLWQTDAKVAPYKDAYLRMKGPVPNGAMLLHSCDNRRCINPNHLTLGSARDNVRDMVSRHRHRSQYGKRKLSPSGV